MDHWKGTRPVFKLEEDEEPMEEGAAPAPAPAEVKEEPPPAAVKSEPVAESWAQSPDGTPRDAGSHGAWGRGRGRAWSVGTGTREGPGASATDGGAEPSSDDEDPGPSHRSRQHRPKNTPQLQLSDKTPPPGIWAKLLQTKAAKRVVKDAALKEALKDEPDPKVTYPSGPFLRLRLTTERATEAEVRGILLRLARPTTVHALAPVWADPAPPAPPGSLVKTQEWWLVYVDALEAGMGLGVLLSKPPGESFTHQLSAEPWLHATLLPLPNGASARGPLKAKIWKICKNREVRRHHAKEATAAAKEATAGESSTTSHWKDTRPVMEEEGAEEPMEEKAAPPKAQLKTEPTPELAVKPEPADESSALDGAPKDARPLSLEVETGAGEKDARPLSLEVETGAGEMETPAESGTGWGDETDEDTPGPAEEADAPESQASYPSRPFLRLRLTSREVEEAKVRELLLSLGPDDLHALSPVWEEPASLPSAYALPPLKTQEFWLMYRTEAGALAGLAAVVGKPQGSWGLTWRLSSAPRVEAVPLPFAGPTGCQGLKAKLRKISLKQEKKRPKVEAKAARVKKSLGKAAKRLAKSRADEAEAPASKAAVPAPLDDQPSTSQSHLSHTPPIS